MSYWPWWVCGLALAGVAILHWLLTNRQMAVSGAITALINRVRFGPTAQPEPASATDMIAAMQAATIEAFGADAIEPEAEPLPSKPLKKPRAPRAVSAHAAMLLGLVLGGALSMILAGSFAPHSGLSSAMFSKLSGGNGVAGSLLLLLGGAMVGFGTRMAGGCTSGHGLCGVSRVQPGSLAATAAFFGAGVAASFLLEGLL